MAERARSAAATLAEAERRHVEIARTLQEVAGIRAEIEVAGQYEALDAELRYARLLLSLEESLATGNE